MNGILNKLDALLPQLISLYTDIHAHPELSMHETRTAGVAARGNHVFHAKSGALIDFPASQAGFRAIS